MSETKLDNRWIINEHVDEVSGNTQEAINEELKKYFLSLNPLHPLSNNEDIIKKYEELAKGLILINNDVNDPSIYIKNTGGDIVKISGNGTIVVDTYEEAEVNATENNIGKIIYVKGDSPYIVVGTGTLMKLAVSTASGDLDTDLANLKSDFNTHKINTEIHVTQEDRDRWDNIEIPAVPVQDVTVNGESVLNENGIATIVIPEVDLTPYETIENVDVLRGRMDDAEQAINSNADAISKEIVDRTESVEVLQGAINETIQDIEVNNRSIHSLDERISEAETNIGNIKENLLSVEGDITTNAGALETLNSRMDSAEEKIDANIDSITDNLENITLLSGNINDIEDDIESINSILDKNEQSISDLGTDINTLTDRVDTFENTTDETFKEIRDTLDNKVGKDGDEITKLNTIEEGAEKNIINEIYVNGVPATVNNKRVDINAAIYESGDGISITGNTIALKIAEGETHLKVDKDGLRLTDVSDIKKVKNYTDLLENAAESTIGDIIYLEKDSDGFEKGFYIVLDPEAEDGNQRVGYIMLRDGDKDIIENIINRLDAVDNYTINSKIISENDGHVILTSKDIILEEIDTAPSADLTVISGDTINQAIQTLENNLAALTIVTSAALNEYNWSYPDDRTAESGETVTLNNNSFCSFDISGDITLNILGFDTACVLNNIGNAISSVKIACERVFYTNIELSEEKQFTMEENSSYYIEFKHGRICIITKLLKQSNN